MLLVINSLRGGHTQTHTHIQKYAQIQTRHVLAFGRHTTGLKVHIVNLRYRNVTGNN